MGIFLKILGFFTPILPQAVGIFVQERKNKHEVEMLEAQRRLEDERNNTIEAQIRLEQAKCPPGQEPPKEEKEKKK